MTEQSKKQVEQLIQHWLRINELFESHCELTKCSPDSPMWCGIFSMFEAYEKLVEQQVNDEFKWISWYIYENACGERKFEAKASEAKEPKPIETIEDLFELLEEQEKCNEFS